MLVKNKKNSLIKNKKIGIFILILLVALVAYIFWHIHNTDKINSSDSSPENTVNLAPPTDEEKKSGDEAKTKIPEGQANTSTSTGQKTVVPIITYAGQYGDQAEVGAFVSTIFEEGGTCTLTLANGATSKTTSVNAVRNANSVDCPVMAIKRSSLTPGKWEATVSYKSNSATGSSEKRAFEVR